MSIEQEIYNKLVEQFGVGNICIKKYRDRPSKTWLQFIDAALKLEASELYYFCGFKSADNLSRYFKTHNTKLMLTKASGQWHTFLPSLVEHKRCTKCKNIKTYSEFSADNSARSKYRSICKKCDTEYSAENREQIKEFQKNYYQNNKEKIDERHKLYYENNKEKLTEYHREYRETNKEKLSEDNKTYYSNNTEKILEQRKQYREVNKEALSIKSKYYYQNNKYIFKAKNAKRRATKLQATPKWADQEKIKEVYKNCPEGSHVDHWAPLQGELVCGLHCEFNLQYLTAAENLAKSNKFEIL